MKTQLSSVDIHVLVEELKQDLVSSRIDKAYQLGRKELKFKLYKTGTGATELAIAPGYLCLTQYPRTAPEQPSSFAMQLRKNLKGGYIREIKQHGFDRIIELAIERQEERYTLVIELFSRGNVILCNDQKKIMGLLEWQEWKDRTLKVGQVYDYPPETRNPLELATGDLQDIVKSSKKKIVVTLASETGIGGTYAEEICLLAQVDKEKKSCELSTEESGRVTDEFSGLQKKIKSLETRPCLILDDAGEPVDVLPFELETYKKEKKKCLETFNEAVDNYFSREELSRDRKQKDDRYEKEINKLRNIESKQEEIIKRFERESTEYKVYGDLIYQNYQFIDQLIAYITAERDKGTSWEEIKKSLEGKTKDNVTVRTVDREGHVTLSIES